MRCVHCGKPIMDGHLFCGWCGRRRPAESRTEAIPPEPSPQDAKPMLTYGDARGANSASPKQPRATGIWRLGLVSRAWRSLDSRSFFRQTMPTLPSTINDANGTPVRHVASTSTAPALAKQTVVPALRATTSLCANERAGGTGDFNPPQYASSAVYSAAVYSAAGIPQPPVPQYPQWTPIPPQPTLHALPAPVVIYPAPATPVPRIEPVPATPTKQALTDVMQQLEQPKSSTQER